ncbi:hypothetical protein PACTADRAFT_31338 [Pachysolen tannophilus NRRL Y-2460]|uniref:Zinc transporter n=1 Tax=Pachysolen tannophilus NRRL Y-2460 TaxID=669874 RepID=A0A1E4U1N4_PACTA|nr:hypothetical protein PACTADRAFT_31338 [Pachysolen tannophilus NRRL Y-2460]
MFLDCTSLFLGLLASLVSKNDAIKRKNKSQLPAYKNQTDNFEINEFPFGLSRIETLAGFTNGSLLIGIVGGIYIESIQRLLNPVDLQKTNELLIVSVLGFIVNLVGIFAFNHSHDAHGHSGHSHSHSHSHAQAHVHDHDHDHAHSEGAGENEQAHDHHEEPASHLATNSHAHSEEEENHLSDNMHGILLHILADTLGSAGVIISTIFIKFFNVQILDPITSILIASLILASSFPLLRSSTKNLLLSLSNKQTVFLKNEFFQELMKIDGIKTYSTPRFWPSGINDQTDKLTGYLHVQFYKNYGNNTLALRDSVHGLIKNYENVFEKVYIQFENEMDDFCWCRKNSGIVAQVEQ